MQSSLYIYSDASFSPQNKTAVLGYAYLNNQDDQLTREQIQTTRITCDNCNRAEIESAILALKNSPKNTNIILYTDCQTISKLPTRREKLEKCNFISGKTGLALKNADLYKKFLRLYDQRQPKIVWVKGHIAKGKADHIHKNFSVVDKETRKKLRAALKT